MNIDASSPAALADCHEDDEADEAHLWHRPGTDRC